MPWQQGGSGVIAVGGRWEGRGEERNMAAGGGQMAARRRTGNMSLLL